MSTLNAALNEALTIAKNDGRRGGQRWRAPSGPRLRQMREALQLTQVEFCQVYGFDLEAFRKWEQDRGTPEQMSQLMLALIEDDPQQIAKLVTKARRRVEELSPA